jgi:hypothetical protein
MSWNFFGISLNCQITGVAKRPREITMGRTWARSRIWMIMAETPTVSPMVNTNSITISKGTHTEWRLGTIP